ncbi:hypothetical protein SUDANB176_07380 [Streptomyces sp. enrichment culture]
MSLDPTGKGQARWTMRWRTALNAAADLPGTGPWGDRASSTTHHASDRPDLCGGEGVVRPGGRPVNGRALEAPGLLKRSCGSPDRGASCGQSVRRPGGRGTSCRSHSCWPAGAYWRSSRWSPGGCAGRGAAPGTIWACGPPRPARVPGTAMERRRPGPARTAERRPTAPTAPSPTRPGGKRARAEVRRAAAPAAVRRPAGAVPRPAAVPAVPGAGHCPRSVLPEHGEDVPRRVGEPRDRRGAVAPDPDDALLVVVEARRPSLAGRQPPRTDAIARRGSGRSHGEATVSVDSRHAASVMPGPSRGDSGIPGAGSH